MIDPRPIREQNQRPRTSGSFAGQDACKGTRGSTDTGHGGGNAGAFVESPLVTAAQRPRFSVRWSLLAGFMLVSAGVLFWRVLNPVSHPMIRLAAVVTSQVGSTAEELRVALDTLALRSPREFALYKTHAPVGSAKHRRSGSLRRRSSSIQYEVSCPDFGTWLDRKIATGSIAVSDAAGQMTGLMFEGSPLSCNIPIGLSVAAAQSSLYSLPQMVISPSEPSLATNSVSAVSWNA